MYVMEVDVYVFVLWILCDVYELLLFDLFVLLLLIGLKMWVEMFVGVLCMWMFEGVMWDGKVF